jgi:hypothetical protein
VPVAPQTGRLLDGVLQSRERFCPVGGYARIADLQLPTCPRVRIHAASDPDWFTYLELTGSTASAGSIPTLGSTLVRFWRQAL